MGNINASRQVPITYTGDRLAAAVTNTSSVPLFVCPGVHYIRRLGLSQKQLWVGGWGGLDASQPHRLGQLPCLVTMV